MEGKDPKLDVETVAEEPTDSKSPIKKNSLIFVLVGIIVVLALILTATPLREVFLTAKTVPEVMLELVAGPELEESGQYRFDVEAVVSGNPVPEVTFSRDDSLGEAGQKRAVIFLNPGESFVLTAVAKNSQGSREASLELIADIETAEYGEEDEGERDEEPQNQEETTNETEEEEKANRPPEIISITMMAPYYTGLAYSMSVSATDPDGDPLSYSWTVDDGSLNVPTSSAITWTMPSTAGFYNITVTVEDGKGGRAEKTETVEVLALPTISLEMIPGGGFIIAGELVNPTSFAMVGDSKSNRPIRGFLSFDISPLAGKQVVAAEMNFSRHMIQNEPIGPDLIKAIWLEGVYWGSGSIQLDDYDIYGELLGEYENLPAFKCTSDKLVERMNREIKDGHDRFQIRLRHKGFQSNNNDLQDAIRYGRPDFTVTYMP